MLHAPWRARKGFKKNDSGFYKFDDNTAIADIIEHGDENTIKILEKFGLYCAGCEASVGENLKDGCSLHGLSDEDTRNLMIELKKSLKKN